MLVSEVIHLSIAFHSHFLNLIFKFIGFISMGMFQILNLVQMLLIVPIDFSLVPFLELLDVIFIIIFFILHQLLCIFEFLSDLADFFCRLLLYFLIVEVVLLNKHLDFFGAFLLFLGVLSLDLIDVLQVLNFSIGVPLFQCLDLLSEFVDLIEELIVLFLAARNCLFESPAHFPELFLQLIASSFGLFKGVSIGLI